MLSAEDIATERDKIKAVQDGPKPKNKHELRNFRDFAALMHDLFNTSELRSCNTAPLRRIKYLTQNQSINKLLIL